MIAPEILAEYRALRSFDTHQSPLCHAPFVSLNFDQTGRVTACCYNREFALGTYPNQSVHEIWTGPGARALRDAFLKEEEARGCDLCFHQLKTRNFPGVLMRKFDQYAKRKCDRVELNGAAPRVLEFEISNTCNLECVMCSGHFSSTIRARRERRPSLRSPYDRQFVEQIEEFLPAIVEAKFLGGEPFLITRYYEIWNSIRRLNPETRLSITTNATVVPERGRDLLEELRANIIVSLDGVTPATYEAIRRNARFDRVMANLEYFRDYTRRRETALTIAVCPMTHNWRDLPAIVQFCEEKQISLYFNTVFRPADSCLGSLSESELAEVICYLEHNGSAACASWSRENRDQWNGLISQLRGWLDEKRAFAQRCGELARDVREFAIRQLAQDTEGALHVGVDRLIDPLVLAYRIERERSAGARVINLLNLLPQTPLPLWHEEELPGSRDLVLAAHIVWRFVDLLEGRQTGAGRDDFVEEHRQLHGFVDQVATWPAPSVQRFNQLGGWIRERIRRGQGDTLVGEMRTLLSSCDPLNPLITHPGEEMRRRLAEGWHLLVKQGLEESTRARIAGYLDHIIANQLPMPLESLSADITGAVEEDSSCARIRDLEDVRAAVQAMYLFHACSKFGSDHESFRRHLEVCVDTLTNCGITGFVQTIFDTFDLSQIYTFMANVSDDELARVLKAVV
jgi:MoaA/NifB/PqqE/SkfB family radical SAM enzyme